MTTAKERKRARESSPEYLAKRQVWQRANWQKHRDAENEKRRAGRAANPVKVEKDKERQAAYRLTDKAKEAARARGRAYYEKNKAKVIESANARQSRRIEERRFDIFMAHLQDEGTA